MGCSILRNKTTNEIENVLANNGEPSLLYKAINEIVPNKEDALTRWLSVYTDTFANTFGNWQLVAEAIEHIKDIVGVYKITGLQNPNKFLYEVSVQAHSSEQERNGVIKVVGESIVKIAEKLYPNVSVNGTYPPVLYEFDENNEPLLTQSVKNFIFSTEEEQKKVSPLSGASIKLDILDRVFKERVDGRYTYKRVSADTAMITNVERSKATSNSSARNIAKSLIKLVYNKYDKGVYGFQYQNSPYDPIYIKFSVTDEYIADEFDRLSAEMKEAANSITDPVVKQMSIFDLEEDNNDSNNNDNDLNDGKLFGLDTQNQKQLEFHVNTLNVISKFLENVGVGQRLVSEFLSQDGSIVDGALAAANFIEGTVDIIDDLNKGRAEAWNKLPEEAAHWWYRLLDTNSELKDALLMSGLTDRKEEELRNSLYGDVYKGPKVVGKLALDSQGNITQKPALSSIREEAIGQLIAEAIKRIETKNANSSDYSFFKKFLDWINSIIDIFKNTTQDPFEVAAMKILSSDMSDLMTWEEYRKLNNIVNFADVVTEQSVAPLDYTILSDILDFEVENVSYGQNTVPEYTIRIKGTSNNYVDTIVFNTKDEADLYVYKIYGKEYDQRQKQILQEVRDNQVFFDRLLNKSFRKKSKFLPKTLRKYFDIIDTQNLNPLREWNISQELQQITKKLTPEEKRQIVETNGYTNIAPTLKVLPDLLKKYKKNPIALSEPIKIDGAKKQELSILNGIKEMIKLENPNLKSITAEEFVAEAHNWLETNYLLGFANENSYLSYRTDQTFTYLKDRISNEDINLQQFTEAEMMAMPPADRQRVAAMMGLTKQNPDVYHNKVSLRFNDMYHLKSGHFQKSPSAWGNLTYFYTGKNKWKDAVLLHEIQNDNIEFLREFKAEKVDLETSLGRYLQQLNTNLLDNITQIESGGKQIIKRDANQVLLKTHKQLNYQLLQLKDLPLEQGLLQLKQNLNELIELHKSDPSKNPEKAQEAVEKAYSKRRIFQDFQKRGGIKSLLTKEELQDLEDLLKRLNTEEVVGEAQWLHEENQFEPGFPSIRDLKQKKKDFSNEVIAIQTKINDKLSDTYGDNAPLINLTAPAKPLPKSQRNMRIFGYGRTRVGGASQELNESVNWLLAYSEKKILENLSKTIEESKKNYIIARNATVANNFNVQLSKITLEQWTTLVENYKYNVDLLNRLIDEQAQKDIKAKSSEINPEDNPLITSQFYKTLSPTNLPSDSKVYTGNEFHFGTLEFGYGTIWTSEKFPNNLYIEISNSNIGVIKKSDLKDAILKSNSKENRKIEQQSQFESLKQKALDKKAELEKNYGKIEEEVKQTLEIEMNYFTPLVHHLIQKHINQYGKDFPMYFSGYNITKLTQGNNRTAWIYAGKDEIDIVDKSGFVFNENEYTTNEKYKDIEGFDDSKNQYFKGDNEISQQEYEKAYQQATERRAKEIKFEAAQQIGIIPLISNGEKVSLEEGIKKLNEYKKQSRQNLDRVINTIMNISNNKPIETGAIYNAMSQVSGIKLIWQDKIEGLQGNTGGYLVDLTNYNYNVPILYGITSQKENTSDDAPSFKPLGFTYNSSSSETTDNKPNEYKEILDKLSSKFGIEWVEDNEQESIGRYENGKVYINTSKIKKDTPFHEFAHPFEQLLKRKNINLWKVLASKARKTTYKGVNVFEKTRALYPELSEEDLISETIVTILGLMASDSSFVSEPSNAGIIDSIKSFFSWLTKYLNSLISNPDKKIKIGDFRADMSFKDVSDVLFKTDNKIDLEDVTLLNATFLQKAEDTFSALKALQSNLTLDESTHTYTFNGKEVGSSVSDLVKAYYTSLFPEKDKSELKKQVDDIIRERGTAIHKDIESIVNRYIDSSTGLKRATPLSMGKVETDADVYTALEAYILKRLNSFDNTTRFMSEVRIYDEAKDMAGTIDLLAIKENGELEIFDWKSIQTIKHDYKIDELPWYKEGAYRIQLKEYKRILEEKIGAKVSNAMAIPIEANVTFLQTAEKKINPIYQSIDIGDVDPSQIPEDKNFLLPVVLREQTTNDKLLDDLIKRLYGMYDEILNERVSSHGLKREEKYRKLKTTQEAIRDLQVRKSMNLFIQNGETVIKNARVRIKDGRIDSGYVEETIGQLAIYQEAQKYLGLVLLDDNTPKEIIQKLSSMQSNATHVINLLIDLRKELAEKMANEVGVVNVGRVEKKVDWLKSTFRSLSTMPIATIRVFYQKLVKKQNKRDFDTNKKIKELAVLEQELIKWAKANGIKNTDMFNMIYQLDENGKRTGKFISKYSKEFYIEKDKAIQNRDLKWLNENTYFDKEAYEESRKTMEEYVKNEVFSSDPEQNEIKANKMMANWVAMYNAAKHTSAVFNKNNRFLKPQDKHFSKEWVNLNKKENIPLKNVYDEFQNILKYSRKIGMLDEQTNTFIPNIEASKIDRIIFGGAKDLFNIGGVFDKLVIDTGSGFGEINPVTGKQIFRVPVPFLRDLGKEIKDSAGNVTMDYSAKSADLFKVFGIWSAQMYNYEIMKDMEDDANLLYQLELNKKSLVTNAVGTVKMVDGEPVESNNNDVNAKIYSDFMNYYIYNKTSDADNDFAFKIGSKTYSGIKSIRALVQYMSAKVLGFNALSASANLFGGQANAFLQASKGQFFNEADWASSLYSFSKRDKVAIGLLDYFDVLLEDQKMRRANKLSVSKAVEHLTTEKLFELQRGTDKLVQYPVLIAMSKSHMVVNGKIVSIKKYVQDKNNYEGSYSRLNAEQRKELRKKIKKEIKEARIHSIFNTAKVVNDELVIPGLQPDSEAAFAFRNKVRKVNKNILGNSTSDDINRARMTIFGQIMMQFRSWMPQMIIERFGEFTYDSDLEIYQYGKTRQFISDFLSPRILGLIKDIFLGVGEDTIERAKAKYAKLREKRFKNGEDFDITETEYIDIYLANLRSQIRELALLCAVGGLAFVGKPGHDDDKQNDGVNRMLHRAFVKYQNELSFYYLPSSLTQILKSPIPIVSILGDLESFMKHSVTQIFAMATDDEKLDKKSHPFKYFGKMIPIVKEGIQWWGDLDDEFAKENGITR